MLEARHATFEVAGKRLVDEADLTLAPGRVISIVGPNGAGKSTLLKLLCGELRPTEGAILLEGRDLQAVPAGELARRRAVVSQSTVLSFPFTVLEVALLGASVPGFGMRDEQMVALAANSIEAVGLKGFEERLYTELSGGERQRVHIARALCQLEAPERSPDEPAAFLLDEPTASLDFSHQSIVLGEARRQAGLGRAVLVILHDLNLAAAYADEIVLMHRGRVRARGLRRTCFSMSSSRRSMAVRCGPTPFRQTGSRSFSHMWALKQTIPLSTVLERNPSFRPTKARLGSWNFRAHSKLSPAIGRSNGRRIWEESKMRNIILGLAGLAVAGVALAGCGEQGAPEFAKNAAMSDLYEVEAGRIATEKGQSDAVRSFGQKMVDAHSENAAKLKEIVQSDKIDVKLPTDLDESHRDMIQQLKDAEPDQFDEEYASQQVDAHQAAVDIFEDYADDGKDGELKAFAADTLPHIQEHLEEAKALQDNADKAEPPAADGNMGDTKDEPAGDSMQ
ncbi:Hemin import ATP-binding protein HmuV [Methyloligella halotolerans]|uniref:Hemin import ATP-binding protein HmuV n=1 Tax=Methyloligella halotolerans TaxID=1177755 RepID=A0A1E2S127_9HYPH|nr:DUF4142 domain-containing protein [Methyloligella halotolerans]ODA68196.1 Hemin import ATP-binding protein HmuV [Methyloligella halotolerans]